MAGSKGLEGLRSNGTDLDGPGYIHPRSDKYRENYDAIFRKKCKGDCEDCCQGNPEKECCND